MQTYQIEELFWGKSHEGHNFTAITDNYPQRGFTNCLINVTSQSHPYCLMGRYENSVDRAVTFWKEFSLEKALKTHIGKEDHMSPQINELCESDQDSLNLSASLHRPESYHSVFYSQQKTLIAYVYSTSPIIF